jgi:hypothetical protein
MTGTCPGTCSKSDRELLAIEVRCRKLPSRRPRAPIGQSDRNSAREVVIFKRRRLGFSVGREVSSQMAYRHRASRSPVRQRARSQPAFCRPLSLLPAEHVVRPQSRTRDCPYYREGPYYKRPGRLSLSGTREDVDRYGLDLLGLKRALECRHHSAAASGNRLKDRRAVRTP